MGGGWFIFVEVHDTGVTCLEEAQSRVADPFLPSEASDTAVSFPNAAQFVAALGGRIELEHDEPFGTSITVVLPA